MGNWKNIHFAFYRTKEEALRAMRAHKSDVDTRDIKHQWRVVKTIGRQKPWGPKYEGYQVQFRLSPKREKRSTARKRRKTTTRKRRGSYLKELERDLRKLL